ncbi:conserved hypothetical protein [Xanthomonas citri pv. citri]|uniref:Uncharacterized protein n=1 Tax=Xanthomonas campestris pv. glycines TaxID=473421 RepID=Q32X82_XANCG|nr:hypothetical protein [Xanthomonas citri pv. glycines]CEF35006.1 conserved hypothetical protein [Xanthomonas citri pv. citri]
MSERETLDQVTAERDFLAGLVEQHEARLRTFSADLQHVLLAEFSGEDTGPEYVGAWQRLHALIAPVATGYSQHRMKQCRRQSPALMRQRRSAKTAAQMCAPRGQIRTRPTRSTSRCRVAMQPCSRGIALRTSGSPRSLAPTVNWSCGTCQSSPRTNGPRWQKCSTTSATRRTTTTCKA